MNIRKYIIVMGGYVARTCSHVLAEAYLASGSDVYCYDINTGQEYIVTPRSSDDNDPTTINMEYIRNHDYVTYIEVTPEELRNDMITVKNDVRMALLYPQDEHEKRVALDTLRDLKGDTVLPVWDYEQIPDYLYTTVINHSEELLNYFTTII